MREIMKELGVSVNVLHKGSDVTLLEKVDINGWKGQDGWQPTWSDVAYWSIAMHNERALRALTKGNGIPYDIIVAGVAMMPERVKQLAEAIRLDLDQRF
ncbi:hypothetical protein RZS08_35615, partial [Arthrospira platensis SPKY1]|nr:hypothetical protein [Arthrospira platensis SPKY1]